MDKEKIEFAEKMMDWWKNTWAYDWDSYTKLYHNTTKMLNEHCVYQKLLPEISKSVEKMVERKRLEKLGWYQ